MVPGSKNHPAAKKQPGEANLYDSFGPGLAVPGSNALRI